MSSTTYGILFIDNLIVDIATFVICTMCLVMKQNDESRCEI